jgi:hypothetical protein
VRTALENVKGQLVGVQRECLVEYYGSGNEVVDENGAKRV